MVGGVYEVQMEVGYEQDEMIIASPKENSLSNDAGTDSSEQSTF